MSQDISLKKNWWKEVVIYQVYPRSFCDSNNDGIGDIQGIINKLGYLEKLGIDILWLSPVYQSPNDDNGYDISDYHAINKDFGTMADFDRLLSETHRRSMKLIMDLVVNHTSDEHPWFIESRSSMTNPKRDWYIWKPPCNGREPNNWASCFTPSAWEFDPETGEYYLHIFSRKQPDLNWRNPEVKNAVFSMMRWWLDKGIDGFRMDVINWLIKAPGLPDAVLPRGHAGKYVFDAKLIMNQPGMHELLQEMNREVLSKYDIMCVGECHDINAATGLAYVDKSSAELDMTFQFDIVYCRRDFLRLKKLVTAWYTSYKGHAWNTITLNNHDTPRQVSVFGDDGRYRVESAKLLATFLLTAPGTPFLFQGEEIGMTNVSFPSIDSYRDIEMLNRYRERILSGMSAAEALAELQPLCRDNARTPMQWDIGKNAGFSQAAPWINVNQNYADINVRNSEADPDSVLNYYRMLLAVRKKNPGLVHGDYTALSDDDPAVYAYLRSSDSGRYLVVLNFSSSVTNFLVPDRCGDTQFTRIAGNHLAADVQVPTGAVLDLRPWEAIVSSS